MKKLFSVVIALAMLLAFCVPAFAGDAVNALTDENAMEIATAIEKYVADNPSADLADPAVRAAVVKQVVAGVTLDNYGESMQNIVSIDLAVSAIQADYSDLLTDEDAASLKTELLDAVDKAYAERPGISIFDPSEIGGNLADGMAQGDLAGLFDSMRGAISSLADRLSSVFNRGGSSEDPGNDGNDEPTTQPQGSGNGSDFEGDKAHGDTALTPVIAVASVAALASAALVLTKKKEQ